MAGYSSDPPPAHPTRIPLTVRNAGPAHLRSAALHTRVPRIRTHAPSSVLSKSPTRRRALTWARCRDGIHKTQGRCAAYTVPPPGHHLHSQIHRRASLHRRTYQTRKTAPCAEPSSGLIPAVSRGAISMVNSQRFGETVGHGEAKVDEDESVLSTAVEGGDPQPPPTRGPLGH